MKKRGKTAVEDNKKKAFFSFFSLKTFTRDLFFLSPLTNIEITEKREEKFPNPVLRDYIFSNRSSPYFKKISQFVTMTTVLEKREHKSN